MFHAEVEGEAEFLRECQAFEASLQSGARRAVGAACGAGIDVAKAGQFKDKTGNLRGDLTWAYVESTATDITGEMRSPQPYSSYVEEGTDAHDIYPRVSAGFVGPTVKGQNRESKHTASYHKALGASLNSEERRALAWMSGGTLRFARMVHHPGSKAYPFMGPAYLKAESILTLRMEEASVAATKHFK
jgi:hypothetical protein